MQDAKIVHYSLKDILPIEADYNIIFGERSNGKTTAVLEYGLIDHVESGYLNQLAIIRRWEEDFKGNNGKRMLDGIVNLGWVDLYTNGKYNSVYYYAKKWYLCKYDNDGNKIAQQEEPFALGFAISSEEHYKSTSYPKLRTIFFDEFISRQFYLPDEFVKFQNLLSTLIRLRTDVRIFMCGNTINKHCPYFSEMGLTEIRKQQPGTIDVYSYGESELKVAVEYAVSMGKDKPSNKYFAFDNPKLAMITKGGWEIDIYPHLPEKYKPKDIVYIFYVEFDGYMLQGNVVSIEDRVFIYLHRKTTPIPEDTERLVYKQNTDSKRNTRLSILHPYGKADSKIAELVRTQKVFYQDNEVGELFRNYLIWCGQEGGKIV